MLPEMLFRKSICATKRSSEMPTLAKASTAVSLPYLRCDQSCDIDKAHKNALFLSAKKHERDSIKAFP
jgi:hypothetical protein